MGEITKKRFPSFEPWQITLASPAEKWLHVWQSNLFTDVIFNVGVTGEEISAHKILLVIQSPVFETMFGQRWNQNEMQVQQIQLPDEDPDTFKILLEFVYTAAISTQEIDKLISTLMLAKKYLCTQLINKCIENLKDSLSVNNVVQIYQVSEELEETELHKSTEEYILHNANSIFTSGEVTKIKKEDLCRLLKNDELNVTEIDLFNAVYSWGRAESLKIDTTDPNDPSVIAGILQDIIPLIRFTNMTAEDFSLQVVPKNILPLEDTVTIFRFMTTPQEKREEVKPDLDLKFNTTKRSLSYFVYNLKRLKGHGYDFGTKWQNLCFQTDRDVRIISLGFFRAIDPAAVLDVKVKILNHDLTNLLGETEMLSSQCFTIEDVFHVKFKVPVKVLKEIVYTISYIIKGKETFYKTVGESTITANCGAEGRVTFKFKEALQNTDMDQVPEICFRL